MSIPIITDSSFENEVQNSKTPVFLFFGASWDAPSRMIASVASEVAVEFNGRVFVGKVDIDESPNLATKFGIRNLPTLLLLKNGNAVSSKVGAMPKTAISSWITSNL
ncbi:thioredoxin family protein [Pseudomonas sp. MF7453]|uniref:thioredoxin family protein n=1 Tax=Pseudomonas sp. MF7453 TaxID=2797539 RepID=UPI0018E81089|nr:thioredoxin domain-containing protein [Pseudomonas sp. MF7453]MBJ2219591.1 thiol reductase thioredoxin [Pseudomonas sp. MF7453]